MIRVLQLDIKDLNINEVSADKKIGILSPIKVNKKSILQSQQYKLSVFDINQVYPAELSTEGLSEGLFYFRGQVVPKSFADIFDQIYNWKVKDDDVWVCSFPKSGTTWTQEMVWMIMNDLDFEKGKTDLDERSPYIDFLHKLPPYIQNSLQYAKEKCAKERVLLKTHLNWDLLPKEIQDGTKNPKIVYVFRNPKDCCVSQYHQCKIFFGYSKSFEELCESFLAGKIESMPYWTHVLPFWQRRHQPNIFFIRYEDMIKDLPAVIRRVAAFLDKPLRDDQVDILTDHLSFSNMKNNPAVNKEILVNHLKNMYSTEGSFMRKGKAGGYKEEMSEEMIRKFDEWIKENTEGSGFTL